MEKKVEEFIECHNKKLSEPIMKQFLQDENNYQLLLKVIREPNNNNAKRELDDAFRNFFKRVKIINYLSNLIYYYSIDYDKKMSRRKRRNIVLEDQELMNLNNTSTEAIDSECSYLENPLFELEKGRNLIDCISNENLYKGLHKISKKQLKILDLKYRYHLSNKEIAEKINESEQNVSYHHRKALKSLYHFIKGGKK